MNDYLIDLPNLNSIKLGSSALAGGYNDSLTMESDINMNELIFRSS